MVLFKIQPLTAFKSRKKKRKKNEKRENGTKIDHMTERKAAKTLQSVVAFVSRGEWIHETAICRINPGCLNVRDLSMFANI